MNAATLRSKDSRTIACHPSQAVAGLDQSRHGQEYHQP